MSLDTTANKQGKKQLDLETAAQTFVNMVKNWQKKDALRYYNGLNEETQKYIKRNYLTELKSASMQF